MDTHTEPVIQSFATSTSTDEGDNPQPLWTSKTLKRLSAVEDDEVDHRMSFQEASKLCAQKGMDLSYLVWGESSEREIPWLLHKQDFTQLALVLQSRHALVRAHELFGEKLGLSLVAYANNPVDQFSSDKYIVAVADFMGEVFDHPAMEFLNGNEFFEKYDSVWTLIFQNNIQHDMIKQALDYVVERMHSATGAGSESKSMVREPNAASSSVSIPERKDASAVPGVSNRDDVVSSPESASKAASKRERSSLAKKSEASPSEHMKRRRIS